MTTNQKSVWLSETSLNQIHRTFFSLKISVTGCLTGLGAAIAKHVLQPGHRVVATARQTAALTYLPDT